jgi:hypothetical protein
MRPSWVITKSNRWRSPHPPSIDLKMNFDNICKKCVQYFKKVKQTEEADTLHPYFAADISETLCEIMNGIC